ncbi:2-keto-4-pentenoate hydratase [Polymorphobacter multimanifer]|nr:fumarylacetoacetate hydrolase family protein [Polymorphobacter multimanifer]GGI84480.1 2-keto-4-pentenoate hydratase [Polymorphobacter multimanifer]
MTPVSYKTKKRGERVQGAVTDTAITAETASAIAAALVDARRHAASLPDYPGPLPQSLDAGYAIQDAAINVSGGTVAGWKVGRIWPPLDARFGSDRLAGPIFASTVFSSAQAAPVSMPVFAQGFGAVEAEFIFRLGDVPPGQTRFSLAEAAALVAGVHVGIEIASSPFAAINDLGPAVTVSDFGNNNGIILGAEIADWAAADIDHWPIALEIDGQTVGRGIAADFPDGTLGSVRFLLELLARRGIAVPPGTLVSTGAITGVHAIAPGQSATARFGTDHALDCHIKSAIPDIA